MKTHQRLLLFLLTLLIASLPFGSVATADDDEDAEDAEEQIWPAEPDVRVQVELLSGRIEIDGWDRDEVRVRVEGDSASALEVKASRHRVQIRGPKFRRARRYRDLGDLDVDVHVSLPRRSRIEARTTNGTIRAEGVAGTLEFDSANGDIEVRGKPTEARLETINASIDFEGSQSRVDARTVNGNIDLVGVTSEVSASAIAGSIRIEADILERIELKTLSGSIGLTTRLAEGVRAHLKSFSGGIQLEVPSDTSARFDIQSFSGGIRNELPTTRTTATRGGGRHLEFTSGEGDGRVTIESFSGGVEIREKD